MGITMPGSQPESVLAEEPKYIQKECGVSQKTSLLRTKGLIFTYNCNLDCTYCYVMSKSSRTMTPETARDAIRSAFMPKNGVVYDRVEIQFMGAEPLTAFDRLKEVAEWTWQQKWDKPYMLFATTNGTLLDNKIQKWFSDNKERFVLSLSYDGTPQMQDINRTNSSSAIDLDFFKSNWPEQSIKMTISEKSVKNLAEGVISMSEQGFSINANVGYEDHQWTTESITEYANQLAQLIDYYAERPTVKRVSFLNLDVGNLLSDKSAIQHKYCGAGDAYDVTDVDGRQYPCHLFSPLVLIHSQLTKLREIDFTEQKAFADKRCIKCSLKNICPTCAGMNYKVTGNPELRDITHCRIFITEVLANIKLQARLINSKLQAGQALTKEDRETARSIKSISAILSNRGGTEG